MNNQCLDISKLLICGQHNLICITELTQITHPLTHLQALLNHIFTGMFLARIKTEMQTETKVKLWHPLHNKYQFWRTWFPFLNCLHTWLAINRGCWAECDRVPLVNEMGEAWCLKIGCCHSCWCQQAVPGGGRGMWCSCYMVRWERIMVPWGRCHRTAWQAALQRLCISHQQLQHIMQNIARARRTFR
jgi:hypothetical protein